MNLNAASGAYAEYVAAGAGALTLIPGEVTATDAVADLPDDRLQLFATRAHPALPDEARKALT